MHNAFFLRFVADPRSFCPYQSHHNQTSARIQGYIPPVSSATRKTHLVQLVGGRYEECAKYRQSGPFYPPPHMQHMYAASQWPAVVMLQPVGPPQQNQPAEAQRSVTHHVPRLAQYQVQSVQLSIPEMHSSP